MKSLFLSIILTMTLVLSGCAGFTSFNMSNQSQQLVVKTSIQLATSTYLDKNSSPETVNLVITITNDIMGYLISEDVYSNTMIGIQKRLHDHIANQDLTVTKKIALTSLSDIIVAQAVSWAKIGLTDTLTVEYTNVLFFCANAMNETAKLYLLPDFEGRSYSVTRRY